MIIVIVHQKPHHWYLKSRICISHTMFNIMHIFFKCVQNIIYILKLCESLCVCMYVSQKYQNLGHYRVYFLYLHKHIVLMKSWNKIQVYPNTITLWNVKKCINIVRLRNHRRSSMPSFIACLVYIDVRRTLRTILY